MSAGNCSLQVPLVTTPLWNYHTHTHTHIGLRCKTEKRNKAPVGSRTSAHTNTVQLRINPNDDSVRVKLIQCIHNKPNRVNKAQNIKTRGPQLQQCWWTATTESSRWRLDYGMWQDIVKIRTTCMSIATNTDFTQRVQQNGNPAITITRGSLFLRYMMRNKTWVLINCWRQRFFK